MVGGCLTRSVRYGPWAGALLEEGRWLTKATRAAHKVLTNYKNGRLSRFFRAGAPPARPSGRVSPVRLRGTSTSRLNSATRTPSWLSTRVWTRTVPAVRLGLGLLDLEHLGLAEQRVAVEDRRRMAELLGGQVGDRLAAHVRDAHPERERVDERTDDDVAALLGLLGVHVVEVERVVVHRDQAEQVVVGLGHGLGGPVLVDGARPRTPRGSGRRGERRWPRGPPGRSRRRAFSKTPGWLPEKERG